MVNDTDVQMNSPRLSPLTRDNHYVPRLYLKHFASAGGYLYRYRTLVSKSTVAEWKRVNISGVGYQTHLYTRALAHEDSDEIEQWLNRDFETPAAVSIRKAVNDERLGKEDYRVLVRFLAAQIVRTPAFLIENLPRMQEFAEAQMKDFSRTAAARMQRAHTEEATSAESSPLPNAKYYPMRVSKERSPDGKSWLVKTETVVGRGMWHFAMRHLLTSTLDRLADHRWVVLSAEEGLPWFTTDDPVVRLRFRNELDYDFKGGWGVPKTNIFLPLSPKHLLFTEVGDIARHQRGDILPRHQAILLRRVIAEHAHRDIFSPLRDLSVRHYRPRIADLKAVIDERQKWQRWHEEQSIAERELLAHD